MNKELFSQILSLTEELASEQKKNKKLLRRVSLLQDFLLGIASDIVSVCADIQKETKNGENEESNQEREEASKTSCKAEV